MRYEILYEIVKLNNVDDILFNQIQNNPNIYAIGLDTMCSLMVMDMPIKNRNIAIRNILSFLRYIDFKLKVSSNTIIPISSDIFIEYFNRNQYKNYMSILKELNIMVEVPYLDGSFYNIENKISKQYRIYNDYLKQDLCLVIFNNTTDIQFKIDGNFNKKFIKTIKNTNIYIKDAINDEILNKRDNNSLRCRLSNIFNLYNERYITKGNKVNRIYHSFTNLSKISRKYLYVDNSRFTNIDIKNCQPLLLCYLLKHNNLPIDDNYLQDCQDGKLYERFYTDNCNREDIKVDLYKNIYFDFKKSNIGIKFKQLYPLTYSSIELLSKDSETMASKLQNIESDIFNNIIPNNSKYYYTLFDAIYFTDQSDISDILKQIKSRFNIYNISPSFRIDDEPEIEL